MSEHIGYEKRDVNTRVIVLVSIISIVFVAVVLVILNDYYTFSKEKALYERVYNVESNQLREIRAAEQQKLNNYEVLDAEKGVYRIPLERAMELYVQENTR